MRKRSHYAALSLALVGSLALSAALTGFCAYADTDLTQETVPPAAVEKQQDTPAPENIPPAGVEKNGTEYVLNSPGEKPANPIGTLTINNPEVSASAVSFDYYYDFDTANYSYWNSYTSELVQLAGSVRNAVIGISSENAFACFSDYVNKGGQGGTWVLNNNISVNSVPPVGTKEHPFTGSFDGQKHTVSLTGGASSDYQGLFGYVSGAAISALTVSGTITGRNLVGGIAGCGQNSQFTGCVFQGSINASGDNVGGIVGSLSSGSIANCRNIGNISGDDNVGGIAGRFKSSSSGIVQCCNLGSVSGQSSVGGICGSLDWQSFASVCYNAASVTGASNVHPISSRYIYTFPLCFYDSSLMAGDFYNVLGFTDAEIKSPLFFSDHVSEEVRKLTLYWNFQESAYPKLKGDVSIPDIPIPATVPAITVNPSGYVYTGKVLSIGPYGSADTDIAYNPTATTVPAMYFVSVKNGASGPTGTSDGALVNAGPPSFAGTYQVCAGSYGNQVTESHNFVIAPRPLKAADFTGLTVPLVYSGSGIINPVSCADGLALKPGADYTVTISSITFSGGKPAEATVTISASGINCTGRFDVVLPVSISTASEVRISTPGVYTIGSPQTTWTVENDNTVYNGGVPVYLEEKSYHFNQNNR